MIADSKIRWIRLKLKDKSQNVKTFVKFVSVEDVKMKINAIIDIQVMRIVEDEIEQLQSESSSEVVATLN